MASTKFDVFCEGAYSIYLLLEKGLHMKLESEMEATLEECMMKNLAAGEWMLAEYCMCLPVLRRLGNADRVGRILNAGGINWHSAESMTTVHCHGSSLIWAMPDLSHFSFQ